MWSSIWLCVIILFCKSVTTIAKTKAEEACSALMTVIPSKNVKKVYCSPPLKEYITNIQDCMTKYPNVHSCSFAQCLVVNKYDLNGLRNDSISFFKSRIRLIMLDTQQPDSKPLNKLIRQCCLCDNNYLNYMSPAPHCNIYKYVICTLFAYIVGQDIDGPSYYRNKPGCSETAAHVKACRPVLESYCPCLHSWPTF